MTTSSPPPSQPPHVVDLVSASNSKIVNVSLYTGRAEVTRVFKFSVKAGQNQVNIRGLPNLLDRESLRVEGRGAATIHDVTFPVVSAVNVTSTSSRLEELLSEKDLVKQALARCEKGLSSLEAYLSTMNVQHTNVADVDKVIEHYDQAAEKLDRKSIALEKKLKQLDVDIENERKELSGPQTDRMLELQVAIVVYAAMESTVEIALIYAVEGASWKPLYDIRVEMETKDKPVQLIYKAAITQHTGEAWNDVPLSLETASPTFGVHIPTLGPWKVSLHRPELKKAGGMMLGSHRDRHAYAFSSYDNRRRARSRSHSRSLSRERPTRRGRRYSRSPSNRRSRSRSIEHRFLNVISPGGINASFRVPGTITIPSDGAAHNVTVVQLDLDASMSWVTVPKIDTKIHLKAKIKNASDYTLLPGSASVYLDGSFISRSNVPLSSPQESFECPLGLDPSVRVVYHPFIKKVSHTGFYSRNSVHVASQRITIHNTKSIPLSDFKVIDQVPVSEHSQITVKLINPVLPLPEQVSTTSTEGDRKPLPSVRVSEGVFAQWEGADEPGCDLDSLGRDGKLNWICTVPPQGKINLLLSWEVVKPARAVVNGL